MDPPGGPPIRIRRAKQRGLTLRLHPEPLTAHAAVHAQKSGYSAPGVLILSVKLLYNARRGRDYTDLAVACAGRSVPFIRGDVSHG